MVPRMCCADAPPPTSLEALRELGSRDDACVRKLLAEAAACGDQFVRRMAIEIIGHHSQGLALRGVVLKALGDHSDYVVRTACEAVARWELIEAHERVVALLANASAVTGRLLFARWMLFGSTRIFWDAARLVGQALA